MWRARARAARGTAATADDDGQWTMAGKDWANTRFGTLAQITADNVKDLRLATYIVSPTTSYTLR